MSNIVIQQTDSNPRIEINTADAGFVIKGNSFVTNPRSFYEQVLAWAKDFKTAPGQKLRVDITPGYYSTSNIQVFHLLLKTIIANNPGAVTVTFFVDKEEKEDMEETIDSLIYSIDIEFTTAYI